MFEMLKHIFSIQISLKMSNLNSVPGKSTKRTLKTSLTEEYVLLFISIESQNKCTESFIEGVCLSALVKEPILHNF